MSAVAAPPDQTIPDWPAPNRNQEQARRMHLSLKALLDKVPSSRHAMPHLAALESMLAQQSVVALEAASAKTLAKMHTQLRVLAQDPADGPIQDLIAVVRRALRRQADRQTHQLSPTDPEATVVIVETSHSDFIDALNQVRASASPRPPEVPPKTAG